MRLLAPAKINLHLRVGPLSQGGSGLAPGGFHPLLTWMVTVGLFDKLTLETMPAVPATVGATAPVIGSGEQTAASSAAATAGKQLLALRCDDRSLPTDATNLVVRIGEAMADTLGRVGEGSTGGRERVSAFLEKRVPAGAGLGGGSSDAAAALRGLNLLWNARWDASRLATFSAKFGSDIPFFFHGPSSICSGKGEVVRPTPPPAVKWMTLLLPGMHVPTPDVYRRFDEMNLGRPEAVMQQPDWRAWTKLKADDLLLRLINDLEPPAFSLRPDLSTLRDDVERDVGKIVRMSGSGSSLFTLFDDEIAAQDCAARVTRRFGIRAGAYEIAPALRDDASG